MVKWRTSSEILEWEIKNRSLKVGRKKGNKCLIFYFPFFIGRKLLRWILQGPYFFSILKWCFVG